MKHKNWTLRNGIVVIEKYAGEVSLEDIISNDDQLLTDLPSKTKQLLWLTDISQARFTNISHEQLAETFQAIDAHINKTRGMKLAIHTGMNSFEDFEKAMTYANYGSERPLSVIFFNSLDTGR